MTLYFINHKKFYFFLYLFKEDTMDLLNDFIFMKNFFTLFLYRIQLDQDSIEICSNITKTGKEKRRNFFYSSTSISNNKSLNSIARSKSRFAAACLISCSMVSLICIRSCFVIFFSSFSFALLS